jgi:glycerophosphoryl diester phosphodiesterase
MNQVTALNWPYPKYIAHRGAGKIAPENTMAAFRVGASFGYRMFECDVKLSSDGVPFLLHDDTLERTSTGCGVAGDLPWEALSRLDAGSWHSRSYAGEPLPTFDAIAQYCLANHYALNIELKPTEGGAAIERRTGEVVAKRALALWADKAQASQMPPFMPPFLSSFKPESLAGAKAAAPSLPRGLLLEALWDGWLEKAVALECVAVICDYTLWDAATVAAVKSKGMKCLSYTVNEAADTAKLFALGIDGIITNAIDLFAPCA